MPGSHERVAKAFAHQQPDRTPLFEIFQPYQPIHWEVCGRTPATDMALAWDAKADGIAWEELIELEARAQYAICKHFQLDMVRLNAGTPPNYERPVKTGPTTWTLGGIPYQRNERTKMVEVANPGDAVADSHRMREEDVRRRVEAWDGQAKPAPPRANRILERVKELARADGVDWVYMGEIGAGTGAAFYPPFQLMWLVAEPDLQQRWMEMQKAGAFPRTRAMIEAGCEVIALGGDVS
mgnify:CR=1 FL=1